MWCDVINCRRDSESYNFRFILFYQFVRQLHLQVTQTKASDITARAAHHQQQHNDILVRTILGFD